MAKATFIAVTVEGNAAELKEVLEGTIEKFFTQNGGIKIQVEEPPIGTITIARPMPSPVDLAAEIDYRYHGISWLARKALWLMALNPDGITAKQLQEKLAVDPNGLSGVLSADGRIRKHSPLHLELYTKHWIQGGVKYKMSSKIAELILAQVEADEDAPWKEL